MCVLLLFVEHVQISRKGFEQGQEMDYAVISVEVHFITSVFCKDCCLYCVCEHKLLVPECR